MSNNANSLNFFARKSGLLISVFLITVTLLVAHNAHAQGDATWGANGNSAWYTVGNWTGNANSSYPGLQGAANSNPDIATFTSAFTGTTVGINMGTASLNLGAISLDSTRITALNIGDSSATAGSLRLYGATVNNVANVIIMNNGGASAALLTLQAAQSGTMGVVLSNATNNIVSFGGAGGVTISSNITQLASGYTLTTRGAGILTLSGTLGYTGATNITGGSTFAYTNAAANTGMGALNFGSGLGYLATASGQGALTFSSISSGSGAFGIIGSTGASKILIGGAPTTNDLIAGNLYFGGSNADGRSFAVIDSTTKAIRAMNYGTDNGAIISSGTAIPAGNADQNIDLSNTGGLSAQQTITIKSLLADSNNVASALTLSSGAILTISSGGLNASQLSTATFTITGGSGLTTSGGNTLYVRTQRTNGNFIINTPIIGTQALSISGQSTTGLTLGGGNTFSGDTRIINSVTTGLSLNNILALQNSTLDMNADDTGTVGFAATSTSIAPYVVGGLKGARPLNLGAFVSIGNNNQSTTYTGVLSGSSSVVKIGTGTLTLSGANTYNGTTNVDVGSLIISGSVTSDVTVKSGAFLRGGSVSGTTANANKLTAQSGGYIAPGVTPGTTSPKAILKATSADISAGGIINIRVSTPGPTPDCDQLVLTGNTVTGTLALLGGTLNIQIKDGNYSVSRRAIITTSNGNFIPAPFSHYTSTGNTVSDDESTNPQIFIEYLQGPSRILPANLSTANAANQVVFTINNATVSPVKLADFTASANKIGTLLSWKAVSEYQNAGYNLYRRELGASEWTKVNPALIAGRVTNPDEKSYSYFDFAPAGSFEYKLESVSINDQIETFYPKNNSVTIDWNTALTSADDISTESIDATFNYFSLTSSVTRAVQATECFIASPTASKASAKALTAAAPQASAAIRELTSASVTPANIGVRWFSASSKIATNSYSAAKVQYKNPGVMLIPQSSMPAGFDLSHVTLQREGRNFNALAVTPAGLLVHAPGYKDDYTDKDALFIRNTTSATAVSAPAAVSGLFASSTPVNVTSTATVTNEYHDVYFDYNNSLRPYNFAPWFSNKYLTQGTAQDFTINLPQASSAPAKMVINLWSVTSDDTINPDHSLQVQVNGQTVVSSSWDGGGSMRQIAFDIQSGILNAGDNTVTLVTPNIAGLTSQIAFLHSIATTYTRALDGSSTFEIVNDSTTPRLYEMYNVPAAGVWIVDARFSDRSALVASESQTQKDGTLRVRFLAAAGGSGKFVITPIGQENQPLNISNRLVKALKLNGTYLATGPAQFAPGTQPLLMKRSREGIRGMYVDQEQLFDYYNHGRYGPDGIRNAVRSTKPTYLLLVGRTTYDYLNYEGQNIDPLCPSYLVSTSFWAQTTSDSLFGDLGRGYPEVAVGRLPVNNTTELAGAVSHITSYKGIPSSGMRLHAVADQPDVLVADFGAQLDTMVKANNPDVTWQENYLLRTYQTSPEVTDALKTAANGGADLILYSGHGNALRLGNTSTILDQTGVQQWTGNTVFLQSTCTANWMAKNVDDYKSIAIQALTQSQGGISASIGTSTYMNPDVATTFMNELLKNSAKPGSRWGQVLLKTQQWAGSRNSNSFYSDLMKTEQLFGDPAMPVYQQQTNISSVNSAAGTF